MLTINDNITGQTLIFMDFFPCKNKDFTNKLAQITAKIEIMRGKAHGRTNANKSNVL